MLITAQKKVPPSAGAYLLARTAVGEAGLFCGGLGATKGGGEGRRGRGYGGRRGVEGGRVGGGCEPPIGVT